MTWKQWVKEIEQQGVDDSTELSFISVDGGYHPDVAIWRPDPDDSRYKVADITQGGHENDDELDKFGSEFSEADTGEFPAVAANIP